MIGKDLTIMMPMYKNGNKETKKMIQDLVISNLDQFIWSMINKSYGHMENIRQYYDDFYNEAVVTIIEHLDRYNPEYRLTTFFAPYIKGAMYSYMAKNIFNQSRSDLSNGKKISQIVEELRWQKGILHPTPEEISDHAIKVHGWNRITSTVVSTYYEMIKGAMNQISLDAWEDKNTKPTFRAGLMKKKRTDAMQINPNLLKDKAMSVEDIIIIHERDQVIHDALLKLDDYERSVIIDLMYNEKTIREIAKDYNTSVYNIEKIEKHSLEKIKQFILYGKELNEKGEETGNIISKEISSEQYKAVLAALDDCLGEHNCYTVTADKKEVYDFSKEEILTLEM